MGSEDVSPSPRQGQHHVGTQHGEQWAQSRTGEGARLQLVEEGCSGSCGKFCHVLEVTNVLTLTK